MSLKKFNYLLALLFMSSSMLFVACNNDDDEELLGDWEKGSAFEGVKRSAAVCFVIDDMAYVGTGVDINADRLNDIWSYDSNTQIWEQKTPLPETAAKRSDAVAFSIGNFGYVGTGMDDNGDELKDFWAFDAVNNAWSPIAEYPGTARRSAVAFTLNNLGYVGTGTDIDDYEKKDFYEYNPSEDSWTKIPFIGDNRTDACAFVIGSNAYLVAGSSDNINTSDFYKFDGSSKTWTELNSIADVDDDEDFDDDYTSIVRKYAVTFTINNKGYLATGSNASAISNVWEYNPTTDLWEEKTEFQGGARTEAVGFAIGNYGYITTGRNTTSNYAYYDLIKFDPNAEDDDTL